ncbi:MAG: hypothetical protein RBS02_04225 [Steroidobacteraceae bacterium]|jgi:hypothetical protein|nr:hypothetical protein [Steroidobacteraceae bacterium]
MHYEKLGSFYLGREVDPTTGADRPDLLLYDSRDLTTHAVCVGMTGSGKTGLCVALLEEAAIDGVPAIAIDPKGDLGNLLLTFPELRPEDFAPWVDPGEAARKGLRPEELAAATAQAWRTGLSEWDQDGERIRRLREAADIAIYTPGSDAGRPLSILHSFAAPAPELRVDAGALRERIGATVSGLLGLVGVDADPINSREYILLSTVLDQAWRAGVDLDLPGLIQAVSKPPFDKIGVFDLETFYPAGDRLRLAMTLNNLIASPGFAAWTHGESLDVQRLLYTPEGKPRVSIISIAHLNDAERMFIVTLLLGEIVAWMRRQSGASSLRALLYMDEIFGYFPPSAMPPSKPPLLTLMKQARAFGLGVVLATQNPVDLDYKGLSNAGTWFIGRLQTERDKARVIDGLLSAAGAAPDRARIEALLANLGSRMFLMRNVHEDAPTLFRTRWALSYLRGPLTLREITRLQSTPPPAREHADAPAQPAPSEAPAVRTRASTFKPIAPAGVPEYYLTSTTATRYEPRVLASARLHFVNKSAGLDVWETRSWLASLDKDSDEPDWAGAIVEGELKDQLTSMAPAGAEYGETPSALLRAASYRSWRKSLAAHAYETAEFTLLRCPLLGTTAAPGASEGEFRAAAALALREKRDADIDKLRARYASRLASLQDQIRRAQERIDREQSQLSHQKLQTAISVGSSLLGALLGRRKIGATTAGRLGSAARSAGRIGRESDDVTRARQTHEALLQKMEELQDELQGEIAALQSRYDPSGITIERVAVKPRKSDIEIATIGLAWIAQV